VTRSTRSASRPQESATRDKKREDLAMNHKSQLQSDVRELEALYRNRTRESLVDYLCATLRKRNEWSQRTKLAEFVALAENTYDRKFDKRIAKSRTRLLIELSCGADVGTKGLYSAATENGRRAGFGPSNLNKYFAKKGGIRNAAYG